MGNPNIDAAAAQAALNPREKGQIDGLSKLVSSHRELMNMPAEQAKQAFAKKPEEQQKAHTALFDGGNPLGDALHYAQSAVKTVLAAPFKALNEVSDFTTRLYRTAAISMDQGVDLAKAFSIANDKGDKVFSPGRIAAAETKYGADVMSVAQKVASGTSLSDIMVNGTDEEKAIASKAAQMQQNGETDYLFQDALDAAQAAKYSPGRQLANALLPESMEGSGLLYKGISGVTDAGFRIFADPTLQLGKAKKAYDAGNWMFYNIIGKERYTYGRSLQGIANNADEVDRVFAKPQVANFFNVYGENLDKLSKARTANDPKAMAEAATTLRRIAPEFGPSAIDEFVRAGIKDADTASNYLKNIGDNIQIFSGQGARKTPLVPILDPARKARINILTTTDKFFDIDKVGRKLVTAMYGGAPTVDDIVTGLSTKAEEIGKAEKALTKFKKDGAFRFTNEQFNARIDRFAQKFATIPFFKEGYFNINEVNASKKVYQLARLGNSRYHSKVIAEAFAAGDEGQKKKIFEGLWNTVGEVRGWNKSDAGQKILSANKSRVEQYAPDIPRLIDDGNGNIVERMVSPSEFGGEQMAVLDWQLSSGIAVPNIMQLDSAVAKDALTTRIFGPNYKQWIDKGVSYWSFGTLAGPRFVIRNASEDLLVHALSGDSIIGVLSSNKFIRRLASADESVKQGFISRLVNKADIKVAETKIAKAIANNDQLAVDNVLVDAIIKDAVGGRLDEAAAERLVRHFATGGSKDHLFGGVSDGANNALRGASQTTTVNKDMSNYGAKMGAIRVKDADYKQATGSSFGNLNPVATQENRVSWMFTITANVNSDLGALAIKNLDTNITREQAIINIRKYLDELEPQDLKRFKLYTVPGETTQTHATAIYDSVRPYFSKRNGDLNTDLIGKVRTVDENGKIVVSAKNLGIDDIPGKGQYDLAPEFISGPQFVPLMGDNFAGGVMDYGWKTMGAMNARLTRQPMAIDALNQTLKTMEESGFRERFIANLTKDIIEPNKLKAATKNADKQLAIMAEDIAINKVLSYVDNPEVRTQLAMNARNLARFYRATEDFYRRAVRTVRYNPESLARASLVYEGIAHSGFVQKDENGDDYFFYPGLSPVYRVMSKVADVFGINNGFQTGMPVQFGAKLKMITPSMNPDSLFPTFAGPLAAFPIAMAGNIVPQFKDLEQYLTGNMGVDQPLINSVLPAHVNRALALLQTDERNSQMASAMRKAATYLEASGQGIQQKFDEEGNPIPATPAEIAAYQDKLQASSMTVMALRFITGFIAPASPSVNLKSDMAKWVRDNGQVNYKSVFNDMITKNNGDIDKAVGEWIKYYPDQMPYTISETSSTVVANVRAVDTSTQWVKDNQNILDKYREAGAFLIPQAGAYDFNAYKLLATQGLRTSKTVTDFVREVSVAKDRETYYQKKDEFDQQLAATIGADAKRAVRNEWQAWSESFKGVRPLLQEQLGAGAAKGVQRATALEDMRRMLEDTSIKTEPETRRLLASMLSEYDSYVETRDMASTPGSGIKQDYIDLLRTSTQDSLRSIAEGNPNALAAYNSLFAPLFR